MVSTYQVHLPEDMASLLNKVSEASGVSSEDILLEWLIHPVPRPNEDNLEALLEDLNDYSDVLLWTVVYRELEKTQEKRHQELVEKHEMSHELSEYEQMEWDNLVEIAETNMLLRSKAMEILKERGQNIDHFLNRELS